MRRGQVWLLGAVLLGAAGVVQAEPYIAAREGLKCMQCHVNPTGGGMRSLFGNAYAQGVLAAKRVESIGPDVWSDALDNLISLGGDLRASARYTDIPDQGAQSEFRTDEFRLYLAANVIPQQLVVYLDQRLAPGGSNNQEAYARLSFGDGRWYVKAGHLYLPYGWRLEDDGAFVREAPGINMTTPDDGVELGLEHDAWSAQLALSNGSAGGAENDEGKQVSLRGEYIQPAWRAGASLNYNHAEAGARSMGNVFAAYRLGEIVLLGEADYVEDRGFAAGTRTLWAGLAEANWGWARGQNLKLTGEYLDPDLDLDEDQRARYSLVWEHTPIQFLQLRSGLRVYDGIPQNDLQNRRTAFVELHAFF